MQSAFTVHIIQTGQHANFSLISTFYSTQQYKNLPQNNTLRQPKFMNWKDEWFLFSHISLGLSLKATSKGENGQESCLDIPNSLKLEYGFLFIIRDDSISNLKYIKPNIFKTGSRLASMVIADFDGDKCLSGRRTKYF